MAESRMNLAALQQRDPFITDIIDTASQVALYSFMTKTNEWEKTSIEGTLFIYKRSAAPLYGFMILNRLGLQNLIEPFTKSLEFQVQEPFLLYRNAKNIYGIWFYEADECTRLGTLMNKLVQSMQMGHPPEPVVQGRQLSQPSPVAKVLPTTTTVPTSTTVDIMKILTKAQHEYDQSKSTGVTIRRSEPKSMTDNLGSGGQVRDQPLVRPTPVKYDTQPTGQGSEVTSDNPMSIEALFLKASISQQRNTAELPDVTKPSALQRSISNESEGKKDLHPLLMQLINKTPTLEQIERQQQTASSMDKGRELPQPQGLEELGVSPRSDVLTAGLLRPTDVSSQSLLSHQPLPPTQPVFPQQIPRKESDKDLGGSPSCPDVLLSPMAFTKTTNPLAPSQPSSSASVITSSDRAISLLSESSESEETSIPAVALTKQQLQQAFIYLLKNDEGFISNLHEAYLKSLQELTRPKS